MRVVFTVDGGCCIRDLFVIRLFLVVVVVVIFKTLQSSATFWKVADFCSHVNLPVSK